jgi:hypothetical protein
VESRTARCWDDAKPFSLANRTEQGRGLRLVALHIAALEGFVVIGQQEQQPKRQKGSGMRIDRSEGHTAMDYAEHERTYKLFLKLSGYLIVGVIVLMACLAIFVV